MGVEPRGAHGAVDLVELARDGILSRQLALRLDQGIDVLALLGIDGVPVLFVERRDAVEMDLLRRRIECAQLVGALEQHVLEVMGHTGRRRRIVLGAGAHNDLGVESGLFGVGREEHAQAVVEPVVVDGHGVVLRRLVDEFVFGNGVRTQQEAECRKDCSRGGVMGSHHRSLVDRGGMG